MPIFPSSRNIFTTSGNTYFFHVKTIFSRTGKQISRKWKQGFYLQKLFRQQQKHNFYQGKHFTCKIFFFQVVKAGFLIVELHKFICKIYYALYWDLIFHQWKHILVSAKAFFEYWKYNSNLCKPTDLLVSKSYFSQQWKHIPQQWKHKILVVKIIFASSGNTYCFLYRLSFLAEETYLPITHVFTFKNCFYQYWKQTIHQRKHIFVSVKSFFLSSGNLNQISGKKSMYLSELFSPVVKTYLLLVEKHIIICENYSPHWLKLISC